MVFLSYHNSDLPYAFRVANLLIRSYRKVWLDRYALSPVDDWDAGIRQGWERATAALVIVSDDYLNSDYCRAEYAKLQERGIAITAVIARDFSTENIADFVFSDWIDFRRWFDEPNDQSMENLLNQIPQAEAATPIGDRREYLHRFIEAAELSLARLPSALSSSYQRLGQEAKSARPRGYSTQPLQSWAFQCHSDADSYQVENLYLWAAEERSFALCGKAGSGKTVFAQMLALAYAHLAMAQAEAPTPFWFDLLKWDEDPPTLEAFIEAEWGLVSYWKHWLEGNRAIFFLDNFSDLRAVHPEFASELNQWMRSNNHHRFVVLAAESDAVRSLSPQLEIPTVSEGLALKFAASLLNLDQLNDFRQILRQHQPQVEANHLDYLAVGLELLIGEKSLAVNQWQGNPLPMLIKLRQSHLRTSLRDESGTQLLTFLQGLAWSMMQLSHHRRVSRADIENQPGNRALIEGAIELGVLCEVGKQLRFQSEIFQRYLAIDQLSQAGVEKYLTAPQFSSAGKRVAQKWDDMALMLADNAGGESRRRLLSRLVDIDPFLACRCLQRHPDLYVHYQEALVRNLVELAANNPTAQAAFRACIQSLPDGQKSAEILVSQLNSYDNSVQLWLWRELLALPMDLPVSFVQSVSAVDRDAMQPVIDRFAEYPLVVLLSYLVKLSASADQRIRSNAIWILGELKYLPAAILLLDTLENADRDDYDEIVLALMKFAYSEILARLLRWSQDNPRHLEHVITALEARGRWVTSRLLRLARDEQLRPSPEFFDLLVDHSEVDIAIAMAQISEGQVELSESVKQAVANHKQAGQLKDRLEAAIQRLPNRQHFELLRADIQKVFNNPPESTVIAGSNLGVLLYGQQTLAGFRAQTERGPASSLPAELRDQLDSADWQQRYEALASLSDYPAEEAIPHLLDLSADRETLVRLAAYESLARYPDSLPAQKALIAALSDADEEVVNTATELLKTMPGVDYDELLDLLESANPHAVYSVIEILAAVRYQPALEALKALLGDKRRPRDGMTSIGERASSAIATIEARQTIDEPAVDASTDYDSAQPKADAAESAPGQDFSDEEKIVKTLQLLRDDDWGRTQKAAKFLRKFAKHLRNTDKQNILELLCDALQDDIWHVRWAVAEALAWLQNADAIPHLNGLLQDPNWIVQVAAVRALAQLRSTDSAEKMLPLLRNPQKAVREATAEALGELGDSLAATALAEAAQNDSDSFVRLAALKSLHEIDPQSARGTLENALRDEFIHLRWYAMQALSPQMGTADVPLLTRLLEDEDKPSWEEQSIRDLAMATLRRIDSPESRAALEASPQPEDQTLP